MTKPTGNPNGRPPMFKSPEELLERSEKYFEETPFDEWAISVLATHLGTYRQLLHEYQKKPEFTDTIKYIKAKIEGSYETSLRKKGTAGDIFALKNFGWKDRTEQDVNMKADVKTEHSGELDLKSKSLEDIAALIRDKTRDL